jgi:hypothetical protein
LALPLVPELTPDGYLHAVTATPVLSPDVLALPIGERLDGLVRVDTGGGILVGGRLSLGPWDGRLFLGLASTDGSVVEFGNLSFGFEFREGETVVASGSWPEPGVRHVSSDQKWMRSAALNGYNPASVYTLFLWVEDGERYEATYTVQTPAEPYGEPWDGVE